MRFIILKLPRTGSSTIAKVLDSHPRIRCRPELLNPVQKQGWREQKKFFEAAFLDHESPICLGATLNPFKYGIGFRQLKQLVRSDFRVICLLRRDLLRQAISKLVVEHNASKIGVRAWSQPRDYETRIRPQPESLIETRQAFQEHSNALREFAAKLDPSFLQLYYEDHFGNPPESYGKIFDFLGLSLPDPFDFQQGTRKLVDSDLTNVLENYDDLQSHPVLGPWMDRSTQ